MTYSQKKGIEARAEIIAAMKDLTKDGFVCYMSPGSTYGYIIWPEGEHNAPQILYVQMDHFGGYSFSYQYHPSKGNGSGCACFEGIGRHSVAVPAITKEIVGEAIRGGYSFARSFRADFYKSVKQWEKGCWDFDKLDLIGSRAFEQKEKVAAEVSCMLATEKLEGEKLAKSIKVAMGESSIEELLSFYFELTLERFWSDSNIADFLLEIFSGKELKAMGHGDFIAPYLDEDDVEEEAGQDKADEDMQPTCDSAEEVEDEVKSKMQYCIEQENSTNLVYSTKEDFFARLEELLEKAEANNAEFFSVVVFNS